MKREDLQKIKVKNEAELTKDLSTLQDELRNLKFDLKSGKLKNFKAIKGTRRKIATVLTVLNSLKHGN